MAKKSAASKGYRKTVKKKPFLTKKEIIALVVIVAAIIIGVVAFNLFYEDGYLRAGDVQPNDVVTFVSKEIDNRYLKVAESKEVDGFTRTNEYRDVNPTASFTYTPDEPTDNITTTITLGGSYREALELARSTMGALEPFASGSNFSATEIQNVTVQDHDACFFSYTMDYYDESVANNAAEAVEEETEADDGETEAAEEEAEATDEETEAAEEEVEAETPASNRFNQSISLYVTTNGDHTVCFHIARVGDDDSHYLPEDEILDYVLGYADQMFTVYDGSEEAA